MNTTTITRDSLYNLLTEHECIITFTKVNGEIREMPCTLKAGIVPVQPITEDKIAKKPNPDVLNVWCTDKKEWRSFRIANVISVKEKI